MRHPQPKKFTLDGTVSDDAGFVAKRAAAEYWLLKEMRDKGYVPMLDQEPLWTTNKNKDNTYRFTLSIYSVYVGKEKSWLLEGMNGQGKFLPRSMPSKLNLF